jgi:hypothetical protein
MDLRDCSGLMTGRKDENVTTKDDQNLSREMVRDDRDEPDDRPFDKEQ